jgi:hypothetical protein
VVAVSSAADTQFINRLLDREQKWACLRAMRLGPNREIHLHRSLTSIAGVRVASLAFTMQTLWLAKTFW